MFDFLGIGDVTSDTFITLEDNVDVLCHPAKKDQCRLSIPWGTKMPYRKANVIHGVGNAANASVSAARLGITSALVASVGKDDGGYKCREVLANNNVNTSHIHVEENKATNHHYVLSHKAERTILIHHEQFVYTLPPTYPKILYLSSISEQSVDFHDEIIDWLEKNNEEIFFAFQPGTFQISLGIERLKRVYEKAHLFICNKEEAQMLLQTTEDNIPNLCLAMNEQGPAIVAITDGPRGAFLSLQFNKQIFFMPQYPDPNPPVERTGAGDAFSSTLAILIGEGMSPQQALRRAPINSMAVVQKIGAQEGLLDRVQLLEYLEKAPKEYKLQQIQ